jgi:hypothetical protein
VLFVDLKDSTELICGLDPEAAQQLLDPAIHRMMDAVHRFEGTVNQVLGDGVMALFGAPNIAARLQGLAAPNTVVISAATYQLLGGFFACQLRGTPGLKGVAQSLEGYQVRYESTARSRLEATGSAGLTPLMGREQEVALLRERWAQVKDGLGQVVLLSGEAGISKSRLVQVLMDQVATKPQAWLTPCQCSPYYQNTALYPLIDLLERVVLRFDRQESPEQKLRKLEGFLVQYGLPLAKVADHLGHTEDGHQVLAEAHPLVEQQEERWWEAEICHLRGVLLLRQAGALPAEVETCFPQALDIARHQ